MRWAFFALASMLLLSGCDDGVTILKAEETPAEPAVRSELIVIEGLDAERRSDWRFRKIDLTDADLVERGRRLAGLGEGGVPACAQCHGLNGEGLGAGGFPQLAGQAPNYLAKQLHDYASGNRENAVMTPIAKAMSKADREAAAAWFASRSKPVWPRAWSAPALIQRGATIHAVGTERGRVEGCSNCHSARGMGRPPAIPRLAGQPADYIVLQLTAWRSGWRRNDAGGTMLHVAANLREDEIAAVAAYLASLPAGEGDGR